jgi:PKD repeat protein
VTDDNGATDIDTTTVTVTSNQPPVASFTVSHESPETNQTITFNASSSSDAEDAIKSYNWTFGDGTTETGMIVYHSYLSNNTYSVTLTVTDNGGLTDTETKNVTVTVTKLDGQDVTNPTAVAGDDQRVNSSAVVTFDASASTDNVGIINYAWDFGDGTTGAGVEATHTYTKEGTYNVTLTVEDAVGNICTDVCIITVERIDDENGERTPLPLSSVATAAVFGTVVAVASQAAISFVSRLTIPNWLSEFLQMFGGDVFEELDEKKLKKRKKAPLISKRELASISCSAVIMTVAFCFVEVNGLPYFLDSSVLAAVIPYVLLAVFAENVVELLVEDLCARMCSVYTKVKFWVYGLVMFLISSFIFRFPIGSPLIIRYQSEEIPNRKKGLIILSKLLILLTLTLPFYILYMRGFTILGDAGLLLTLMTVFYYFIPLKPIAGKAVFDYQKAVSLLAVVSTGTLFFSFTLNLLPRITYFIAGIFSLPLAAISVYLLSKSPTEATKKTENM